MSLLEYYHSSYKVHNEPLIFQINIQLIVKLFILNFHIPPTNTIIKTKHASY